LVYGRDFLPHGHDYVMDVAYDGEIAASDGLIVNIIEIKPVIAATLKSVDGQFLQYGRGAFPDQVPTLEHLGQYLWSALPDAIGSGNMCRLRLRESRLQSLEVTSSQNAMTITRSYEFAAAHRLYAPALSDEENWVRYDKCSNAAGHGHNYGVEVSVSGLPDPETGFIIPPEVLDRIVDEEIYCRFDHKHLNVDCPEFRELIPTSENLARVIFDLMKRRLEAEGHTLAKIGLHETQKNYFEVTP